jgi:hypothetical protein
VIFLLRKAYMAETPKDYIESEPLNRVRLAIGFRHAGACVDFEDWDGLSDDQVRQSNRVRERSCKEMEA